MEGRYSSLFPSILRILSCSQRFHLNFSLFPVCPSSLRLYLSGESLSARRVQATFDLYAHKSRSAAAIRRPSGNARSYRVALQFPRHALFSPFHPRQTLFGFLPLWLPPLDVVSFLSSDLAPLAPVTCVQFFAHIYRHRHSAVVLFLIFQVSSSENRPYNILR